jgi:hypothetical protein
MGKVWKRYWLRNLSAAAQRQDTTTSAPVETPSVGDDNVMAADPVVETVVEAPLEEEVAEVVIIPKKKAAPKKRAVKTRNQT